MITFITIAIVYLLGLVTPGPDFAIVIKQSVINGRVAALWTTLGIALGNTIHMLYSIVGIGLVISQSILLFNAVKYAGAAYLVFIGIKSMIAKKNIAQQEGKKTKKSQSAWQAVRLGFCVNALNP